MIYLGTQNIGNVGLVVEPEPVAPIVYPTSDKNYLYFQAEEDGVSVSLKVPSSFTISLQYSTDGTAWNTWISSYDPANDNFKIFSITLTERGDYVFLRATDTNTWTGNASKYLKMILSGGKVRCGGNIMSLRNKNLTTNTLTNYCFYKFFKDCTALTSAPELSATTLAPYCYAYMFEYCVLLKTPPELQATALSNYCYQYMFSGCTSLETAPNLPATACKNYCYQYMFNNCVLLKLPPVISATTSATSCFSHMFMNCVSLKSSPTLYAETLSDRCYEYMFYGCTSLTTPPEISATTLAANCCSSMFAYCISLTTAPELYATTMAATCCPAMFRYCLNLAYVKVHITTWDANQSQNWLDGVKPTGTFSKPSGTEMPSSAHGIPSGWTVDNY